MNLRKKKKLIARTLKVGVGRIKLDSSMAEEIKEAITRQDIKDLRREKIIMIKEKTGKLHKKKRKTKKKEGKRKKKMLRRKHNYVKLTRKLRSYLKNFKKRKKISREEYYDLRKKIKAEMFRDFSHLKNILKEKK